MELSLCLDKSYLSCIKPLFKRAERAACVHELACKVNGDRRCHELIVGVNKKQAQLKLSGSAERQQLCVSLVCLNEAFVRLLKKLERMTEVLLSSGCRRLHCVAARRPSIHNHLNYFLFDVHVPPIIDCAVIPFKAKNVPTMAIH